VGFLGFFFGRVFYCQPWQQAIAAGGGGSADLQIVYNVEYLFEEDGKEVRKVPIEMNGETIWVESVGGVGGPGGLYKSQDSIIMDLNENDGRFFVLFLDLESIYDIVEVPNSKLVSWSNSCARLPPRRPRSDSRPGHVSLGSSSLGWR
jgi:hypothetical protein